MTLDNTTTNLSALSSYNNSDTLLFYATDLPQDMVHQITVTNQENRTLALRVGGVNTTSFENCTTYVISWFRKANGLKLIRMPVPSPRPTAIMSLQEPLQRLF